MKNFGMVLMFASIGLISCFAPITEDVVFAVEDNINPVVVIASPDQDSIYMSEVTIEGYVKDDSRESGDNKGSLSSLSVSASTNNPNHRGKIKIGSDGSYETDTSGGNISGSNFTYRSANKSFRITIDSTEFQSQTMYITIEAVDRNGNESNKVLRLRRSDGPYMKLTSGDKYSISETSESAIVIEGELANSSSQRDEYDELKSLGLEIIQLGINVTLDESKIRSGEQKDLESPIKPGSYLRYATADLEFEFHIRLWESQKDNDILTLIIVAEDKNGNTTRINRTLTKSSLKPIINTEFVERVYYYSGLSASSGGPLQPFYAPPTTKLPMQRYDALTFNGNATVASGGGANAISELKLKFTNTTGSTEHIFATIAGSQTSSFNYTVNLGDHNLVSGAGDTTITLVAKDDFSEGSRTSERAWLIKEDSTPPSFSPRLSSLSKIPITTDTGRRYVGPESTVTLRFRIEDGRTGVDFSTLSGTVAGISLSSRNVTSDPNTGNCTVEIALTNANQSTGDLDISINVKDKMGNTTSIDESSFSFSGTSDRVQFISGTPSLSVISIASSNATNTSFAQVGDRVTLTVTSSQLLKSDTFRATIAGKTAAVTQNNPDRTLTAQVTIPSSYTTTSIPFEITFFENAAGTDGVVSPPIDSTSDSSSVTLYRSGPSLITGQVNSVDNAYIRSGGPFSLSVTSDQVLDPSSNLTVQITPNPTTTPTISISDRSFTVTVDALNAGSSDARIAITISGARNAAGISQSSSISTNLDAWYYPGAPTLTGVSMSLEKDASNTGGADVPEINDKVVLEFSVENDRVLNADPVVSFTSNGKTLGTSKDGRVAAPDYKYTHTIVAGDLSGNTEARVTYTIGFTDMAGNTGTTLTDISTFKISPGS